MLQESAILQKRWKTGEKRVHRTVCRLTQSKATRPCHVMQLYSPAEKGRFSFHHTAENG